jgi:hypothetical protein
MTRKFDQKFTDFPLCFLTIGKDAFIKNINAWIIIRHLVNHDPTFEFEFADAEYHNLPSKIEIDKRILSAALELNIPTGEITDLKAKFKELKNLYINFKSKYGEDAYCRIGNQLLSEVQNSSFDWDMFRIYCAIHSTIGKKGFYARICKKQILIRMNGYKSNAVLAGSKSEIKFISRYKLDKLIDVLELKKMFSKVTVFKRLTYYSTRYSTSKLKEVVRIRVLENKKKKLKLRQRLWNIKLVEELKELEQMRIKENKFGNNRYN